MNIELMPEGFADRTQAGDALALKLAQYANRPDTLVLALPRGGVPVAYRVAAALNLPMDVFVVRKLGVPGQEELAMGAIASGGVVVLNRQLIHSLGITESMIRDVKARELDELHRRELRFRGERPEPQIRNRTIVLIDDGLATGATMQAAIDALRRSSPSRIVVATPVASPQACELFRHVADECVCVITPEDFGGVGRWYRSFEQITDDEVRDLLARINEHDQRRHTKTREAL